MGFIKIARWHPPAPIHLLPTKIPFLKIPKTCTYLEEFRPLVVAIIVDQISGDLGCNVANFMPKLFRLLLLYGEQYLFFQLGATLRWQFVIEICEFHGEEPAQQNGRHLSGIVSEGRIVDGGQQVANFCFNRKIRVGFLECHGELWQQRTCLKRTTFLACKVAIYTY